jgi:cytidylate kinase
MAALTVAQMLAEALAARHKLATGSMREEVTYGADRVKFTPADINKLESYIADLQAQLAGGAARGAIGVIF